MKIIAIKPAYDFESKILKLFFEDVIKVLKDKENIELCDINDDKTTYEMICDYLNKSSLEENKIICFYGHGTKSSLLGWNKIPLFHIENIAITRGWHFYTVACNSVSTLGLQSVKLGVNSYIGYKDKFIIGSVKNNIIKGLKESVNKGIIISIESRNYDINNVFNEIIAEFDFWINYHSELLEIRFSSLERGTFEIFTNGQANSDSCKFSKEVLMYNKSLLDFTS